MAEAESLVVAGALALILWAKLLSLRREWRFGVPEEQGIPCYYGDALAQMARYFCPQCPERAASLTILVREC